MKKKTRDTIISFRLPTKSLDDVELIMESYGLKSYSEYFRRAILISIEIERNKATFNDPKKCKEFLDDLNSKMTEEKVFDWVGQLSDTKMDGLKMALELEKDKRTKLGQQARAVPRI